MDLVDLQSWADQLFYYFLKLVVLSGFYQVIHDKKFVYQKS